MQITNKLLIPSWLNGFLENTRLLAFGFDKEETELIIKILELSGILIKDLNLYQVFDKEENQKIQQEKS